MNNSDINIYIKNIMKHYLSLKDSEVKDIVFRIIKQRLLNGITLEEYNQECYDHRIKNIIDIQLTYLRNGMM